MPDAPNDGVISTGAQVSDRHKSDAAVNDPITGMRWIPGGTFRMGADGSYPEEAPVHSVTVSGFWMDEYAVTNAEFAAFVAATGYMTLARVLADPYRIISIL